MMNIAILGTSPIMLIAAHYLSKIGCIVQLFEKRPLIGGAWTAPGMCGLQHRHANIIVAYNNNDLDLINKWKTPLLTEMSMGLDPISNDSINIQSEYKTSFSPNFIKAYINQSVPLNYTNIDSVIVDDKSVEVNGQFFDLLLLPAFCSIQNVHIKGMSLTTPFCQINSLHTVCEDRADYLKYVYAEGNSYLLDRYFKSNETGNFVARLESSTKKMSRKDIYAKLENYFKVNEIFEYTSFYRNSKQFDELKGLEFLSNRKIQIIDTRQFCWGLRDMDALYMALKD